MAGHSLWKRDSASSTLVSPTIARYIRPEVGFHESNDVRPMFLKRDCCETRHDVGGCRTFEAHAVIAQEADAILAQQVEPPLQRKILLQTQGAAPHRSHGEDLGGVCSLGDMSAWI